MIKIGRKKQAHQHKSKTPMHAPDCIGLWYHNHNLITCYLL